MISTFETRLHLTPSEEQELTQSIQILSGLRRVVWVLYNRKTPEISENTEVSGNTKPSKNQKPQAKKEKTIYDFLMSTGKVTAYQAKSLFYEVQTEHAKIATLTKTQLRAARQKQQAVRRFMDQKLKEIKKVQAEVQHIQNKCIQNRPIQNKLAKSPVETTNIYSNLKANFKNSTNRLNDFKTPGSEKKHQA